MAGFKLGIFMVHYAIDGSNKKDTRQNGTEYSLGPNKDVRNTVAEGNNQ
jgi:hypothetical protein